MFLRIGFVGGSGSWTPPRLLLGTTTLCWRLLSGMKVSRGIFYLINRTTLMVSLVKPTLSFIWTIFVQSSSEVPHVDATLPTLALSWPHACRRKDSRTACIIARSSTALRPACEGGETRCYWHVYRVPCLHKTWPHGRSSAVMVITGSLLAVTEVPVTRREARFSLSL